ncbi:MAG: dephospho-CoA kinase [Waddliaceae bacterium]
MLKLKKIAVTGGLSSGKSLVCKYLAEHGAYIVNADEIVHKLLNLNTELGKKVVELVGPSVIVDDAIDRKRVATKVFLNPKLLRLLEQLLHPPTYKEIEKQYRKLQKKKDPPPLFVAEVPLLFETGGDRFFDFTVAVIAERGICWERYRKMTGYEREDFNRRMARQFTQHEKAEKADYIIRNYGTTAELRMKVKTLFDTLTNKSPI